MAQGNAAIVIARDIQKIFRLGDRWVQALDGLSMDIPSGQFVCIMGPSGSGKSTLLYVLSGLDQPTSGKMVVEGHHLDQMSSDALARFRREMIGFVFQAFYLVPTMTALENVALPGVFAGVARDAREERAARLLTALGMRRWFEHRPSQLSGGQQQRVAIARALFNDPPIIVADEPTGALDSKTGQSVMRMLRQLCDRQGKTIIVVSHDPSVAAFADRIVNLRDGRIVEDRPTGTWPRERVNRDVA